MTKKRNRSTSPEGYKRESKTKFEIFREKVLDKWDANKQNSHDIKARAAQGSLLKLSNTKLLKQLLYKGLDRFVLTKKSTVLNYCFPYLEQDGHRYLKRFALGYVAIPEEHANLPENIELYVSPRSLDPDLSAQELQPWYQQLSKSDEETLNQICLLLTAENFSQTKHDYELTLSKNCHQVSKLPFYFFRELDEYALNYQQADNKQPSEQSNQQTNQQSSTSKSEVTEDQTTSPTIEHLYDVLAEKFGAAGIARLFELAACHFCQPGFRLESHCRQKDQEASSYAQKYASLINIPLTTNAYTDILNNLVDHANKSDREGINVSAHGLVNSILATCISVLYADYPDAFKIKVKTDHTAFSWESKDINSRKGKHPQFNYTRDQVKVTFSTDDKGFPLAINIGGGNQVDGPSMLKHAKTVADNLQESKLDVGQVTHVCDRGQSQGVVLHHAVARGEEITTLLTNHSPGLSKVVDLAVNLRNNAHTVHTRYTDIQIRSDVYQALELGICDKHGFAVRESYQTSSAIEEETMKQVIDPKRLFKVIAVSFESNAQHTFARTFQLLTRSCREINAADNPAQEYGKLKRADVKWIRIYSLREFINFSEQNATHIDMFSEWRSFRNEVYQVDDESYVKAAQYLRKLKISRLEQQLLLKRDEISKKYQIEKISKLKTASRREKLIAEVKDSFTKEANELMQTHQRQVEAINQLSDDQLLDEKLIYAPNWDVYNSTIEGKVTKFFITSDYNSPHEEVLDDYLERMDIERTIAGVKLHNGSDSAYQHSTDTLYIRMLAMLLATVVRGCWRKRMTAKVIECWEKKRISGNRVLELFQSKNQYPEVMTALFAELSDDAIDLFTAVDPTYQPSKKVEHIKREYQNYEAVKSYLENDHATVDYSSSLTELVVVSVDETKDSDVFQILEILEMKEILPSYMRMVTQKTFAPFKLRSRSL